MAEWVENKRGQDNMISLGFGAYFAPLPVGWTLEPGPPLTGDVVWPRGERLAYSLDCYEDAEAAAGGERLVDLTEEEEYGRPESGQAILDDIQMMIPVGGPGDERPTVWKWMEPFGGTHVRELRLALPSHPDIDLRATQMTAVVEWLGYGKWAHDRTRLDDLAQSNDLRRETFGDSLVMRVPRDWGADQVKPGRWAVEPEDELETLWVSTVSMPAEPDTRDEFAALVGALESANPIVPAPGHRLLFESDEAVGDFDLLYVTALTTEDDQGPLRRLSWRRYSLGEGGATIALIHLCTDLDRIDEPRFVDSAALIDREVRNAAVIPLRPGR